MVMDVIVGLSVCQTISPGKFIYQGNDIFKYVTNLIHNKSFLASQSYGFLSTIANLRQRISGGKVFVSRQK